MRRDQLEHAIRTACQIIGQEEVIIIGSQAILGSYREDELPPAATMSLEVDVLPIAESNGRAIELADQIEGVAGEWSRFEQTHGYRIDGVDLGTAVLPEGWRARLVRIQNASTAGPGEGSPFIGWCLNKEDLCVAKLCAHREKDREFVRALVEAEVVDRETIAHRLTTVPEQHEQRSMRALRWLRSLPWASGSPPSGRLPPGSRT